MSDPTAPAQPVSHTKRPVAVDAHTPIPPPNVAVIIVTWNRAAMVCDVIAALARQRFPRSAIDAVVVDNASTDGTAELLVERWGAERIVPNPTQHAHEPAFAEPTPTGRGPNRAGLRSLTVVRNAHNLGGCGGFNTGFAYVQHAFDVPDSPTPPDYVWLVDDDIDLPDDAAQRLVEAATNDPSIGLVGSRTVDIRNRDTTIETTVYFDRRTGLMTDNAPPGHPRHDEHKAWAERVGGTKGRREYSGLRDVDVVSACSLLARWSAVREVGFWDWRYFIYCDDADWCLRFARAGRRVVLNLDAVVYHTPWHHKLTPARLYYAQRNILWVLQKILPPRELRRVTLRRLAGLMKDSLVAATHRRLFHAEIIRRTADDACRGRAGKLDFEGPPTEPLMDALERTGALAGGANVVITCNHPDSLAWSAELRAAAAARLAGSPGPRWVEVVRNDVPGCCVPAGAGVSRRVVYAPSRLSRLRRQWPLVLTPVRACIVFDQVNDFPLPRGRWNIHVDRRSPDRAQVERDGPIRRAAFLARWFVTGVRCVLHAATLRPYKSSTRYG